MKDMDVHKVLQIVLQSFTILPCPFVSSLDALCLPVSPVDSSSIESKPKGVRKIASNQYLSQPQQQNSQDIISHV